MDDSGNFTNLSAVTVSGTLSAVTFTGSGAGLTGVSSGGSGIDNTTVSAVTPSSGVATLSLTSARNFTVSTNANITSWSFTNVPAVARIKITLTNSGSPATTVIWPTNIKWNRQIVPAWLNDYGTNIVVTLLTTDTGTTWYGWIENDSKYTARTREVYAWGWGVNGGGGWGDTANRSSPVLVATGEWDGSIIRDAVNGLLVGKADGTLWGTAYNPTIDNPPASNKYSSWVQIGTLTANPWTLSTTFQTWRIKKAASTGGSIAVIRQDGTLWGVGNNQDGGLGTGDATSRSSWVQIGSASNWVQVYMGHGANGGGTNLFAVNTNGEMYAAGTNFLGCLGVGDTINRSSLTLVAGGITWSRVGDQKVYPGGYIYDPGNSSAWQGSWTLAIAENGDLYAWGANNDTTAAGGLYAKGGQLGLGDKISRSTPVKVGSDKWKSVNGNFIEGNSFGIKSDGTLYAWGANQGNSSLGLGDSVARSSPVQVGTFKWKIIVGGPGVHAIRDDNTLWGWGRGDEGIIGNGTSASYSSPIQIALGSQWVDVLANRYYSAGAIRDPNL